MPGTRCSISSCRNSAWKAKKKKRVDLSFHRFPTDPKFKREWVEKCCRGDDFNPDTSHICSDHFKPSDFARNMKAELMNLPFRKKLKKGAVPSLQLPWVRYSGVPADVQLEIVPQSDPRETEECPPTSTETDHNYSSPEPPEDSDTVSKVAYNELLLKYMVLEDKCRSQDILLKSARKKRYEFIDYQTINERLRNDIKNLKQELKKSQTLVGGLEKHFSFTEERQLLPECEVEETLRSRFTPNEVALMTGKKKTVQWTRSELARALTLRHFSEEAFSFVRDKLKFPLPDISSVSSYQESTRSIED